MLKASDPVSSMRFFRSGDDLLDVGSTLSALALEMAGSKSSKEGYLLFAFFSNILHF